MSDWGALNARARGLGGRLQSRAALRGLAHAGDTAALAAALAGLGFFLGEGEGDSRGGPLELAIRRQAGDMLRTLARWAAVVPAAGAVLFEDEDRRSVRTLLRGAAAGAAPEARLAGLVPTPALPARALEELAGQPDVAAMAALLSVWGSAYGRALLPLAVGARPELFELELSVNRTWASRLRSAARRSGGALRAHVARTIDLENATTALVVVARREEPESGGLFLEGGGRIDAGGFADALSVGLANGAARAARMLAGALGGSGVGAALRGHALDPSGLEAALLGARMAELRVLARIDPLGPWPVLLFGLRLRAVSMDLRRLVWGTSLGAPPDALAERLVGP